MKLTKYQHACLVLQRDGQSLIIDPGNFTDDFVLPSNVVAVVITHVHPDHCDADKLRQIVTANPDVMVFALAEVSDVAGVSITPVHPGDSVLAGVFSLEFTGGAHATIHENMAPVGNVGVLVNGTLYYPGDSFVQPPRPVRWLAAPISAPWLKVSESIDFINEVNPEHVLPTHDAILSSKGQQLVDRVVAGLLKPEIQYQRLDSSESVEL